MYAYDESRVSISLSINSVVRLPKEFKDFTHEIFTIRDIRLKCKWNETSRTKQNLLTFKQNLT